MNEHMTKEPEQDPPEFLREKLAESLKDFHHWTDLIRSGEAEVTGLTIKRVTPQRTWVGLTDEELRQIWYDDEPVEGGTYVDKLRQVEAKLKEKNT